MNLVSFPRCPASFAIFVNMAQFAGQLQRRDKILIDFRDQIPLSFTEMTERLAGWSRRAGTLIIYFLRGFLLAAAKEFVENLN